MTLGGTARVAAARVAASRTNGLWILQSAAVTDPRYVPVSRTMAFTTQCSPAVVTCVILND